VTAPGSDPLRTSTGPTGTPGPTNGPATTGPTGTPGPTNGPATTGPATAGRTTTPERHPARAAGRTLALALLLFVTVLLVLFVVFNTQTVEISLVFTDVRGPLVVALLVAAILGGLIVGLLDAVMVVRRRRNR
jgi:uncharacterized integral membrane protein